MKTLSLSVYVPPPGFGDASLPVRNVRLARGRGDVKAVVRKKAGWAGLRRRPGWRKGGGWGGAGPVSVPPTASAEKERKKESERERERDCSGQWWGSAAELRLWLGMGLIFAKLWSLFSNQGESRMIGGGEGRVCRGAAGRGKRWKGWSPLSAAWRGERKSGGYEDGGGLWPSGEGGRGGGWISSRLGGCCVRSMFLGQGKKVSGGR